MNIPNTLTILRIFFVPVLVVVLVQEDWSARINGFLLTNNLIALAIFLAASGTDLLDGYLARRWKQITTVGTLLDPIADKLLISSALIALVEVQVVPAWMVVVIVGREFAVTGLRGIAASAGFTIKASDLGKTKMMMQVIAVTLLLLGIQFPLLAPWAQWWMWGVMIVTLVSAGDYFWRFWRKVDEETKNRGRRELLILERQRQRALLRERRQAAAVRRAAAGRFDKFPE
ncbi:MAG TPA: CDP-diacylglycerol--glycerol-3-phosphate 3-phosphatidyltransferase [Bryobacteraceae bacterium]|nr:CDP-diacylglycerol--glycerol-3-phosphate 3-phosphatidyltransferase [Bryobacteraceae bacterium]